MAQTRYSRRRFIRNGTALGVSVPALGAWLAGCGNDDEQPDLGATSTHALEQDQPRTINIAINESPWLPSFEAVVDAYQQQTDNTVNLRVFDFGGLLTQQINAMSAGSEDFDIFNINEGWTGQFYNNGWVTPLREIDPDFEWDPQWIEYGGSGRWNADQRTVNVEGEPMAVPINGNIHVLVYRRDLYDDLGLTVPETFEAAMANGRQAMEAGAVDYGYATRGQGDIGGYAVTFDFGPVLHGYEADWFADPNSGDWTPAINSDAAKQSMATFLELLELGPADPQTIGQPELMSLFQTGRVLQGHTVNAVYPTLDDPAASTVAGNVDYAVVPRPEDGVHAPHSGIWVMGIPPQIADAQKTAAYNFLRWLMEFESQLTYAENGGIVTRQDVYESDLSEQEEFRYMQATAQSSEHIVGNVKYFFSQPMLEMTERRISEIVSGSLGVDEGMETMADELQQIVDDAGLT